MRRKQATALIDELRQLAAEMRLVEGAPPGDAHARLLSAAIALVDHYEPAQLQPCDGEAHSNAYLDNCSRCAPRWGWVGPVEVVS